MTTAAERHQRGVNLFQAGRFGDALRQFREALAQEDSAEHWSDWATAQFALGQVEEAEAGFRVALEIAPDHAQIALNLGVLLAGQQRYSEAISFLQSAGPSLPSSEAAAAEQLLASSRAAIHADPPLVSSDLEHYLRAFLPEDPNERSYFETHLQRYLATLALLPQGQPASSLLELGAAFHHLTPALARHKGYARVRCNDIWQGDKTETRRLISSTGESHEFPVDNFDVQSSPWPYPSESFDAVLCCEMLEHLYSDPVALFVEIHRILKPAGLLLLTTPNLASCHSLEWLLRGDSPYVYGKFEIGGAPTDRHNREYTAGEVERLALAAGFSIAALRTRNSWWNARRDLLRLLAAEGCPISRRGDNVLLLACKSAPVRNRYPEEFYQDVGTQVARRSAQSPSASAIPSVDGAIPRHVLFVHDQLPQFDSSGADLRLFEVVREFVAIGHRVTFVARNGHKSGLYAKPLEDLGVKLFFDDPAHLRHFGDDRQNTWQFSDVLRDGKFDIAILTHWFWSLISVPEHYLDLVREHSPQTRVVLLSDDRHGERERRMARLTGNFSDEERGNSFEQREVEAYRRADLILYITEADRRRFLELAPGLPLELLPMTAAEAQSSSSFDDRDGFVFLGNFENLANRDALSWLLDDIWPLVRAAQPGATLYVAGNGAPLDLSSRHPGVVCLGRAADLAGLFASRRVFVGPIRFGTGINTKNIQAMAHGIPLVTTSVGAEGIQLSHGTHALIADTARDFAAAMLQLYQDPSLWATLASQSRRLLRAHFSMDRLRSQIQRIVSRAMSIEPASHDASQPWSFLKVEKSFPEVLTQHPPHHRPALRTLAYWQLGRSHLNAGEPALAIEQFRHAFAFVRDRIPGTAFHLALLRDMASAFRSLDDAGSAARCEKQAQSSLAASPAAPPRLMTQKRKSADSPDLSVIIPTFNRRETLRLCLAALAFQSLPANRWEVIVIDDGSIDGTESFFRNLQLPFRLRYLRQHNQGAGAARRAGVEAARGELLLLINDDTIASGNLLAEHLAFHRRNKSEQWAALGEFRPVAESNLFALPCFINSSGFFFPQKSLVAGRLYDQAYFVTCNLSVPRNAVLDAGNFDPSFRLAEDTELGARLVQRGYRVCYHPSAVAWHEHPRFCSADLLRRAENYAAIDWLLFAKHPHLLGNGSSPFGLLTSADQLRIESRIHSEAAAAESGLAALQALDSQSLVDLLRGQPDEKLALERLMEQLSQVVPLVYWHHLLKSFLHVWRSSRHPAQPSADLSHVFHSAGTP